MTFRSLTHHFQIRITKSQILVGSLYNKMHFVVLLHVIENTMRNVEGVN